MPPADTSPEARDLQVAAYRAMGPERRLMEALRMSEEVHRITAAGVRARHPEWSAVEIDRAVAALFLGPELAKRVQPASPVPSHR
jgi:hypothetical protein